MVNVVSYFYVDGLPLSVDILECVFAGTHQQQVSVRESERRLSNRELSRRLQNAVSPLASSSVLRKQSAVLTWLRTQASRPQRSPQDNLIRRENGSPEVLFQSLDSSNGAEAIPTDENRTCLRRDIRFHPFVHFGGSNLSKYTLRADSPTKCDFKTLILKIILSFGIGFLAEPRWVN